MNLRQVETFYWAARLGSFAQAAHRLNATQSAISMRIQELEARIGIALFDRSQRLLRVAVDRVDQQLLELIRDTGNGRMHHEYSSAVRLASAHDSGNIAPVRQ